MQTVWDLWQSFARDVIPPEAPPIQRQEMRRAFYAAAWAVLQEVKVVGEESVSEEAGIAALQRMEAELCAFQQDVQAGRA